MAADDLPWSDLVLALPVPWFVLGPSGRLVSAGTSFLDTVGIAPDDADGADVSAALGYDWLDAAIDRLLTGAAESFESATPSADPSGPPARRVSLRRVMGADSGPFVIGMLVPVEWVSVAPVGESIAERLLTFTGDTVTLVDAEGRIVATKGMFVEVQGYPSTYWQGRYIWEVLPSSEWREIIDDLDALLGTPGAVFERESEILDSSGSPVRLATQVTNCTDDPVLGGFVVVTRDVTEQHAAMTELSRRQRVAEAIADTRNRLLATVSHELRNPLHAVRGLAELLVQEDLAPRASDLATTLARQISGLSHITQDLLDAARLDAGGVEIQSGPVALHELVADVIGLGRAAAGDKALVIEASVASDVPPWVATDDVRLRQILGNLVGNAVKFTASGAVRLRVVTNGQHVVFSVADTGVGIPAEEQETIMQPFTVASTAGESRGAGLGLSIVHRLVGALGGEFELASEPGSGTRITVALPMERCAPPDRRRGDALPSGLRVLVVEDNPVNQQLARSQLERLGLVPVIAGTGEEGFHLLMNDEEPFDVVLMDQQLPGWTGIETTERIRAAAGDRSKVPIIGLSASASSADYEAFMASGMDDFVAKPASLDDLSTAIGAAVGREVDIVADRAAEAVAPDPLVDVSTIATLAEELGGVELVADLVELFLGELDDRVRAITTGSGEVVSRTAHTLKSSSRLLGANVLADACAATERSGHPADDLVDLAAGTRRELEAWRASV